MTMFAPMMKPYWQPATRKVIADVFVDWTDEERRGPLSEKAEELCGKLIAGYERANGHQPRVIHKHIDAEIVEARRKRGAALRERIMEIIGDGEMTHYDVADELGLPEYRVGYNARILLKEGRLKRKRKSGKGSGRANPFVWSKA